MEKRFKKFKPRSDHISSYWSVHDITKFPLLLKEFGSNWNDIADAIGTKSVTMVKNYYQRGLVDHPEWQTIVQMKKTQIAKQIQPIQQPTGQLNTLPQVTPSSQQIISPTNDQNIATQFVPQISSLNSNPPLHNGPSMGYFFKPENAYSASFPRDHVPPVLQHREEHLPHLENIPQFVPITQTTPLYSRFNFNESIQQHHINQPPSSNQPHQLNPVRNKMMNMSSLLNASNNAPPVSAVRPNIQLPPLSMFGSGNNISNPIPPPSSTVNSTGPRIMNLLNNDNITSEQSTVSPFNPQPNNLLNVSTTIKHEPQQDQPQQQQQSNANSQYQNTMFSGGTSALDALARIAFERK